MVKEKKNIEKFNKAFWDWFGDSKVVNEDGSPKVVYHGGGVFDIFEKGRAGKTSGHSSASLGFWFTNNIKVAQAFAAMTYRIEYPSVVKEVYLKITNPKIYKPVNANDSLEINDKINKYETELIKLYHNKDKLIKNKDIVEKTDKEIDNLDKRIRELKNIKNGYDPFESFMDERGKFAEYIDGTKNKEGYWRKHIVERDKNETNDKFREYLILQGYDGIIIENTDWDSIFQEPTDKRDLIDQIIVFSPNQIKSATGNDGTWDSDDDSILSGINIFSWIKREIWSTDKGQIRFSIIPIDLEHWHGRGENFTEKKAVLGPGEDEFFTYILEKNVDGYWIELTSDEYESPSYKEIKDKAEYELWEWKTMNPEVEHADFGKTLFGLEALPISTAKEYTKAWKEAGADKIYEDYFKGENRIYLPVNKEMDSMDCHYSDAYRDIAYFLVNFGYLTNISLYQQGLATIPDKTTGKEKTLRIGKILNNIATKGGNADREPAKELLKRFEMDKCRDLSQVKSNLLAVISRHPYDIAGMSTDRGWTSCLNIGKRIDFRNAEYEFQNYANKIAIHAKIGNKEILVGYLDLEGRRNEYPFEPTDSFNHLKRKYYFGDIEKVKSDLINSLKNSIIDATISRGCNAQFVIGDVRHGTLVAYLINENDKNIEHPLGRVLIKRLVRTSNIKKSNINDDFLTVSDETYGTVTNEFIQVVRDWVDEYNKNAPKGTYVLPAEVYPEGKTNITLNDEQTLFGLEALPISTAKEYTKAWKEAGADKIYEDYFKGENRIYLPVESNENLKIEVSTNCLKKSTNYQDIYEFLSIRGYKFTRQEYIEGFCLKQDISQGGPAKLIKMRIGKVLNKLSVKDTDDGDYARVLLKRFETDKCRELSQNKEKLLAVISRHPYDIAGMSTDRGWISCLRLGTKHYFLLKNQAQFKLKKLLHPNMWQLSYDLEEADKRASEIPSGNYIVGLVERVWKRDKNNPYSFKFIFNTDNIKGFNNGVELYLLSKKYEDLYDELFENLKNKEYHTDIMGGCNERYVMEDVKHGTLVAYLINENDKNIKHPLGRVLIKRLGRRSENDGRKWKTKEGNYISFIIPNEKEVIRLYMALFLNNRKSKSVKDIYTLPEESKHYKNTVREEIKAQFNEIDESSSTEAEYKKRMKQFFWTFFVEKWQIDKTLSDLKEEDFYRILHKTKFYDTYIKEPDANFLTVSDETYGTVTNEFIQVVRDWVDEYNKNAPKGTYVLPADVYPEGKTNITLNDEQTLFGLEALPISTAKEYTKAWKEAGADKIYEDYFKGENRIYLPLKNNEAKDISCLEKDYSIFNKVTNLLNDYGYATTESFYLKGLCFKTDTKTGKRIETRIGKILNKLATGEYSTTTNKWAKDLLKLFETDKCRELSQNKEKLLAVISRHPYDIAGMSTDRGWTSCLRLGTKNYFLLKNQAQYKLSKSLLFSSIAPERWKLIYSIGETDEREKGVEPGRYRIGIVEKINKKVKNNYYKYKFIFDTDNIKGFNNGVELYLLSKKYEDLLDELFETLKNKEYHTDLMGGCNESFVIGDVRHGTLVAYLINENDKNIEHPLGRVLIKRLLRKKGVNVLDNRTDFLTVSDETYGTVTNEFIQVVRDWVDEYNKNAPKGTYVLPADVYPEGKTNITLNGLGKHPDYNFRRKEDIENFDSELESYLNIKDYDEFVEAINKIRDVLDEMTAHQKERLKNLDEFYKLGNILFFKKYPTFEKYAKHEVGKTYKDSMNRNATSSRQDAKKWYDIYRNLAKRYNIELPYDPEYDEVEIKKRDEAEKLTEAMQSRWRDLANRAYRLKKQSDGKAKLNEITLILNKVANLIGIREVQREVFKEEMEK